MRQEITGFVTQPLDSRERKKHPKRLGVAANGCFFRIPKDCRDKAEDLKGRRVGATVTDESGKPRVEAFDLFQPFLD
jgi:hypothetical protein